jgi:hypothetical protein
MSKMVPGIPLSGKIPRNLSLFYVHCIFPPDYWQRHRGLVISIPDAVSIDFFDVLWHLHHAPNFEEGVVDTVLRGGSTQSSLLIRWEGSYFAIG